MKRTIILCCVATALLAVVASAQDGKHRSPSKTAAAPAPLPLDHGGKIETKYDGFSHETIVALRRMGVTCEGAKGAHSATKGVCVDLAASLHCPGKQLDYVRYARLQLIFESKDWDNRHPLNERELSAVADGETIRLGKMQLASQGVGEGWLDQDSKEVLEVSVPYAAFARLARAQVVEMSVGKTTFELREKNVAALRDLNNRVKYSQRQQAEGRERAGGN
jgi:hypothetical protein